MVILTARGLRSGRISLNITESRAIIEYCRAVGSTGLEFWEMTILSSLLNNCQTWINISYDSIKILEDLQNTMFELVCQLKQSVEDRCIKVRIFKMH